MLFDINLSEVIWTSFYDVGHWIYCNTSCFGKLVLVLLSNVLDKDIHLKGKCSVKSKQQRNRVVQYFYTEIHWVQQNTWIQK